MNEAGESLPEAGQSLPQAGESLPERVEIRRSAKRRRTVSAYVRDGRIVVMVPASLTAAEEAEWVRKMVDKLRGKRARGKLSDAGLAARARELSNEFLDGRARPSSVRWVSNQRSRWGSCTPSTGEIRISDRIASMPGWVRDYVLIHELAHLLASGHDERFWSLVHRFPRAERAMGYLQGYAAAAQLEPGDEESCDG
ncbi:MAG: M48 family metallopeptidase [Nocardioides sp.]